ncbi:MAG: efflux RND transporter periplasmic adaptor subunit [Burkholderiaceae bacterium]|nr:efflux RND transporter periplasmic adaptor subunit [Burkholderiaceae bacterium]
MRRWLLIAFAVAAVIAAAALWLSLSRPLVEVIEVRRAPLVRTVQFSARVATLSRVDVGSTLTGRVAKVHVRESAQVRQGDVLVTLESDELRAAQRQAEASQRQAEAHLKGLRTTGRASSAAAVSQADATLSAAQAEMVRAQQLVAQGFVSASRLDETRRAVEVARAQQASARAQVQANADAGSDIAQAEAQLAVAQAANAATRSRLAQTVVRAPADARVLARDVEPGQIVQPGRSLLSLALAGPTQLKAQADERFLGQLQAGQTATVVADAFADRRFAARVLSIAPAVDAQRGAIEVKLALVQQAPDFLREDMTLSVEVETARRDNAVVLPLAALRAQAADGTAQVMVHQDGRAQTRRVRLGLSTLEAAEIVEGLAPGEAVLLGGALISGQRVRTRAIAANASPQSGSGKAGSGSAAAALSNAMGR